MADIQLLVGGMLYSGWTSVSVTRSIETVAGQFDIELTERWGGQAVSWPIRPGDECEVRIGGVTVIAGYVDVAEPSVTESSHGIRVSGRDKTGDLVDCAAVHKPSEWRGQRADQIAAILAAPFGVQVVLETSPGATIPVFKLEPGETAFKAIERACKLRGVLPIQARGALVLTHAGQAMAGTPLVLGGNLKEIRASYDYSERFSEYVVKGQRAGSDADFGAAVSAVEAGAFDPGIRRYRPFVKVADGQATPAIAQRQADWERQVRAARSTKVSCVVAGWRQESGALWDINQRVRVDAAMVGVAGELLVSAVCYTLGDGGETTKLDLMRADAFLPEPDGAKQDKPARKGKRGKQGDSGNAAADAWEMTKGKDGSYVRK